MDYDAVFSRRGIQYQYAMDTYPDALEEELRTAVSICQLKPHDILLNLPAAGVPLNKYLPDLPIVYLPFESNRAFAEFTHIPHCSLMNVPVENHSVDVVVSVASFHHATLNERKDIYREIRRILKSNGLFVLGDVASGSPQDHWLNTFVNTYNSSGHHGLFWSESDQDLLQECGFQTKVTLQTYTWKFDSTANMVDFSRNLFGIDLASDEQILDGIQTYLKPYEQGNQVHIPWELLYFQCRPN